MTFNDNQTKALKAKLDHRHVRAREQNGTSLSYVEGWHVIAEANRIFGFDSWDRQTLGPRCLWSNVQRGTTICCYAAKVRVTVRAGATVTVREGMGTGQGRSEHPEEAHELALKSAETDATKRALATFGNPFGLALYDREKSRVTKPRKGGQKPAMAEPLPPLPLVRHNGTRTLYASAGDFVEAMLREIGSLDTVASVYEFWTANFDSLVELRRRSTTTELDPAREIVEVLKRRARRVGLPTALIASDPPTDESSATTRSQLMIPKEKRLRNRSHLAFVARQPCLVCGRRPSQAHHLRFAQSRAMAMKVSDEFTLPLCNGHHDELHRTGDERAWWARHGIIEPLKFAARLWAASRQQTEPGEEDESSLEIPAGTPMQVLQLDKPSPGDQGQDGGAA